MHFEWDDDKNRTNFEKHGIRFEEAALIFLDVRLTTVDTRHDYGEVREISIGRIHGRVVLAVVHTDRSGTVRLISARPAKRQERKRYDEHLQKIDQGPVDLG